MVPVSFSLPARFILGHWTRPSDAQIAANELGPPAFSFSRFILFQWTRRT